MTRLPEAQQTCDAVASGKIQKGLNMAEQMMQAVWYEANGAADEVLVHGEMPIPVAEPGEVLVRLHTSGVNPSDVKARAGSRPMIAPRIIPHSDGAGIVEAVGSGVNPSLVGRRVFIRNGQWQRPYGTAADYIALDARLVHELPDEVSFETGAALGIPALTAAYALFKDGAIADETVLIHGVGGKVARLAVQMAVDAGAHVIATTSQMANKADILALGARSVVDYTDSRFVEAVADEAATRPITRIIDAECGRNLSSSIEILAPKGVIVGYGSVLTQEPSFPFLKMMFKNITLSTILVYLLKENEAASYADIVTDMLVRSVLDVPISGAFPVASAADAHKQVESGQNGGATILSLG